jgi:hypothetical protein
MYGSRGAQPPRRASTPPRPPLFDGCGAERLGKQIGVDDPQKPSLLRGDVNIRHLLAVMPVISMAEQTSPTHMLALIAVKIS